MSVAAKEKMAKAHVFNVPNQLTAARLALSILLFILIPLKFYLTSAVVFAIAASTDWVDGYWARKYGQVTTLGRIFDPLVDKVIVCGTFIYLAAVPNSGVEGWVAVLVVGRELMVTALRNFLEGEGADFSAKMAGKLKMVAQCAAALLGLYGLSLGNVPRPDWLAWSLPVAIWVVVVLTAYSGLQYVFRAANILRRLASS